MEQRELISFLNILEKMKCNTRHSWTTTGRQESVAEHSWRLAVMAMLLEDSFPELDIQKVVRMCLLHDLGEAVTGDIPAFYKTKTDEKTENEAVQSLLKLLPSHYQSEWAKLFAEMNASESKEAKLYKALDKMEVLIQHNEADISTWLPLEYKNNLIYGEDEVAFSEYTQKLRQEIVKDSLEKIDKEQIK